VVLHYQLRDQTNFGSEIVSKGRSRGFETHGILKIDSYDRVESVDFSLGTGLFQRLNVDTLRVAQQKTAEMEIFLRTMQGEGLTP
jgi:hypothetical protein